MIFRRSLEKMIETQKPLVIVATGSLPQHPFFTDVLEAYGSPFSLDNAIWLPYTKKNCPQEKVQEYARDLLRGNLCVFAKPGESVIERQVYRVRDASPEEVIYFHANLELIKQQSKAAKSI